MRNILFVIALASSGIAQAAPTDQSYIRGLAADQSTANRWIYASSTQSGSRWLVRARELVTAWDKGENERTIWLKLDHQFDKTETARTSQMLVSINCVNRTVFVRSYVSYKADGTVATSYTYTYAKYDPIVPDSAMEPVQVLICP